jgi:hypothetical protein
MIFLMSFQQIMRLLSIKSEVPGGIVSVLVLLVTVFVGKLILDQKANQIKLKELNESLEQKVSVRTYELSEALSQVKTLSGLIPICCYCKQIRNDSQSWQQLESYISEHSYAEFSHGICPDCLEKEVNKLNS